MPYIETAIYHILSESLDSMSMSKVKKTFRFDVETVRLLEEIAKALNTTETEACSQAIKAYHQNLKGEKTTVSFSEYKALQERVEALQREIGVLEGRLREKDKELERRDYEYETILEILEKPWWKFW